MMIDSKKSSDTCYYLYSSYVCSAKNTDLKFHLEQYGKPVSELKDDDMATQKEDIALGIGKMPLTCAVNPENNKEQFARFRESEINVQLIMQRLSDRLHPHVP